MGTIAKLIEHYQNLPNVRIDNKLLYVFNTLLSRALVRRGIIDAKGTLTNPRHAKPKLAKPKTSYKSLVSVGGFGWSGSSAAVDLLHEYKGVTTEYVGVAADGSESLVPFCAEFELARAAGGLFSLEHVFQTPSFFERDAGIRIFATLADWIYLNNPSFYGDEFVTLTRDFLEKLIFARAENASDGYEYCHHLDFIGTQSLNRFLGRPENPGMQNIYYLKNLSQQEYRAIAHEYIEGILRYLKTDDMLILDQATSDVSFDVKKYRDYFGPIKSIFVWRDPSEVYAASQMCSYCPQAFFPKKVDEYIPWYREHIERALSVKDDGWLTVRFEDLLFKYDREVEKIEKFLGLKSEQHTAKQTQFIPQQSISRSVGLWKKYPDQDVMKKIREGLRDYIYEN